MDHDKANHDGITATVGQHLHKMEKEAESEKFCAFCFQMTLLYTVIRVLLESRTDIECADMMTHALSAAVEDEKEAREATTMH